MLNRRGFIVSAIAAGLPLQSAYAASPKKIFIITFRGDTDVERGFKDYFKKNNLAVDFVTRDLGRDVKKMPDIIAEIRQTRPDLIMSWGTSTTLALVGAHDDIRPDHVNNIPVVFALVSAPVESKIVQSTSGHGRMNLTGVSHMASLKSQVLAINTYKKFTRLGFLYTSTEQNSISTLNEMKKLAQEFQFKLIDRSFAVENNKPISTGYEALLAELKKEGAEWLYLPPDSFLGTQAKDKILPFAHQLKIPTFASTEQLMDAGAMTGLFSKYYSVGDYAGFKAGRIMFQNAKAGDIEIDSLTKFSYNVNMQVAKAINQVPPLSLFNFLTVHSPT
jgi:putative tryptophan/tyrosine transport system substrate-binding protein